MHRCPAPDWLIPLIIALFFLGGGEGFSPAKDLYVSVAGSDQADGSKEDPLATIAKARDLLRLAPDRAGSTVWLADGLYRQTGPLTFTAEDSGTPDHPVTYRAMDGATPRLTCGRLLAASDFQPVTDDLTVARLAQEAKSKVLSLDLDKLGVVHAGPYADVFHGSGKLVDLTFDGQRQPLARYPKQSYLRFLKVLDNAGGLTNWRDPKTVVKADPNGPGGTFQYRDEDAAKFETWSHQLDRGIWLMGYWRVAWEVSAIKLKSIDLTQHTATFAKPVSGGIGNKYTRPAGNGREAYWVLNQLEELTQPGEWCIDFKDHTLYFYPPGDLAQHQVCLLDQEDSVIEGQDVSHLVLQGLTVEGNLGNGIRFRGGEDDLIAGCTVRFVDAYGAVLDGGHNNAVLSSDFYHLGEGGIWLGGGDEASTPPVPAGHRVINNHIHDFAELERVYAPGVNCGFTGGGGGGHHPAVGMLVAHNLIHDTPHGGVLFGSRDSIFEYNEVFRYCLVSNDLGAFYGYDKRERHFGNLTFRYNFIHNSRIGDGIYFDYDHPDMHLIGNIICLNSDGKRGTACLFKQGGMGQDHVPQAFDCVNNLAINCTTGYEFMTLPPHSGTIAQNVAVQCKTPFAWRAVGDPKPVEPYGTGPNVSFDHDPGFVDAAHLDFHLKPDAELLQAVPGFQPIPIERIGLYVDAYRESLPTEEELDRAGVHHPQDGGLTYDILDRPK